MKDDFFETRPQANPLPPDYAPGPDGYPFAPEPFKPKRKFAAVLLSALVPGTGQMYLGALYRGIAIMLMLVFDIVAIVFFVSGPVEFNALPVTLLSLLIPVLYFYNVFDAVHQTDAVNRALRQGYPYRGDNVFGTDPNGSLLIGFIGAVIFFCSVSAFGGWWNGLITVNTALGGGILLVAGSLLFLKEFRGKKR